ncbi:hypothetical protein [Mucilaginibacter sp.]
MATVSAVVYQDQKKADGTYNVKIRVFHKKERRILDTTHFVTDRQLDKEFKIKDKQLVKILDEILDDYRESISQLGPKLDFFNVEELKNYLRDKDKEVDFIAFCTLKGRYTIVEKELNPFFVTSDLQPYLVVLHPWDEKHVMVEPIYAFDEENDAFHEVVSKVDEAFFMYMYAATWQEAEIKARVRFKEMEDNGEWLLLKDTTDK